MRAAVLLVMAAGLAAAACDAQPTGPSGAVRFEFDFRNGPQGWTAGFSDYLARLEPGFELVADYRALELPLSDQALFIAGTNYSEDLFMFYKRQVAGLDASRTYRVSFAVEIATDVPFNCVGIGGPPGEGVLVTVGASAIEPVPMLSGDGRYSMNIDKSGGGGVSRDAVFIGHIANSVECQRGPEGQILRIWEFKRLESTPGAVRLQPEASGRVWLLMGTDSGFGGRTSLYNTRFVATFTPE